MAQEQMILTGRELEPSRLVDRMVNLYDDQAQEEFFENRVAIQAWIDKRFGELGIDTDRYHSIVPTLNAYNRTAGLGIQSINLPIRRDDAPLRIQRAFKDSTIGVITGDLLDGPAIWSRVGFPVEEGQIERLHQLSPSLRLAPKDGKKVKDGRLKFLRGSIDVVGPEFATTILQRKRTKDDKGVRSLNANRGVYACDYLQAE